MLAQPPRPAILPGYRCKIMSASLGPDTRIFITGHRGLVGSGVQRYYQEAGYQHVLTRSREELDLTDPTALAEFLAGARPHVIIAAAAKVGGIAANMAEPVEFLHDNLIIQSVLLREAQRAGVETVVMLGSSCIYPRACPQPMREEYLMTGPLEPTNEGYALAKLAGLKLGQYYEAQYGLRVVNPIPCNVYGTNDHFDLKRAHVLGSFVRRFVDAKESSQPEVVLWGTGAPRREFIHVDDLSAALHLVATEWDSSEPINVGSGLDVSIRELADLVSEAVGYEGVISWDHSKPDGMPRKLLDVSRIRELGFESRISLEEGIHRTVAEYSALKRGSSVA